MFDWNKYAVGGATRPDSFTGLNPDFSTALSQMLLAAEADLGPNALSITSAYRSPEKQAELYEAALKKYGSPAAARQWVAPPGRSMHNKGLAVDFGAAGGGLLRDPNSREAQWLKANATKFGLDVPMSWEPWQVELAGAREGKKIAAETMSLLGKGPQTSTKGPQMMQEQKPQGLLGSLGIQKRDEAAGGETAQPFYQRDSFKDTAAVLAQGFGRMGIMGMEEIADNIAKQRTENKARNKTLEYLSKMPNGDQLVELAQALGPRAVAEFVMKQQLAAPKVPEYETKVIKLADGSEAMVERMKGTNDPWQPSQLPAGGTTGTGAPTKKLTEGQSKLTLFQTLQNETQPVLLELEKQFNPANLADPTMARLPIAGNYFTSPEYQMYKAAASAWAEGALRISTGAAATQPEIERNLQTYFAQPGDTPQTVAFKAQMREMYDRAVNGALGQTPTGERLPIPTPADFATQVTGGSPSSAVNDVNAILGDG